MKIKEVLILSVLTILVSCAQPQESNNAPENCSDFDDDEQGCLAAGCNIYEPGPAFCMQQNKCIADHRVSGFCGYTSSSEGHGTDTPYIREGAVVGFHDRIETGGFEQCDEETQSPTTSDHPQAACWCFWLDDSPDNPLPEGECW